MVDSWWLHAPQKDFEALAKVNVRDMTAEMELYFAALEAAKVEDVQEGYADTEGDAGDP